MGTGADSYSDIATTNTFAQQQIQVYSFFWGV